MPARTLVALFASAALLLGGCAQAAPEASTSPRTIDVPGDADTIQAAVDQARPGDRIEVAAGVYEESVAISTPEIVLHGTDRDGVVIDGGGLRPNGIVVTAPGVAVENLTVRDHTLNGVLVTGLTEDGGLARGSDGYTRLDPDEYPPLQGFAVRYVTASNNGLYGIYAFDAQHGVIEENYASGHADSGIYVGQCLECDIVVRSNVAESNAVGYEQTNASAPVTVVQNRFTGNRVGASILSDYQEAFVPQSGTTFAGNLVSDNARAETPEEANGAFGIGVAISGGQDDLLLRNLVSGHPTAGVMIGSSEDIPPDRNRLEANVLDRNVLDLAYTASERAPGAGLCATGDTITTTSPSGLLTGWDCAAGGSPRAAGVAITGAAAPAGIPFTDVVAPPPQPSMPSDADPGIAVPEIDLEAIGVPGDDLLLDRTAR
ncbi:nitrous oxide reductase family maturation protein NosD [Agromyces sp. NPDC058110]|uniref:right-handed parallel beta-helix repeat-containing protein n=1 Tax=Agromyces sp. NPDC058110 TaxID=3346345 RepID=UPI0036D9C925